MSAKAEEKSRKASAAPSSAEKPLQLTGSQQLSGEIGKKYKLLVQILTSDPRYARALADVIPAARHEDLASAIVNISYEIGASLGMVKALIGLEFGRKKSHPTTIMRSNSVVEKMTGKYSRLVGIEYLQKLIGKLVKDIYDKPDDDLSVDKERMQGVKEEVDKKVEENIAKVTELCQAFVDRIVSKVMIDEMPRQLRAICYFIACNGEQYKLDFDKIILPLISGFIMLRYIQPAIALPHTYGIQQKPPAGNVRNTLTLIAKILQKMANGETFNTESPSLMPFNSFIQKNQKILMDYMKELPKDPEEVEGRLPFGDLQKSITFEDIHYKTFDMKDLLFIHQMIYEYGYELIVALQTEVIMTIEKRPVSIVSTETDFLALIQDLGAPPEKESKLGDINKKEEGKKEEAARKPSIIGLLKGKEKEKPAEKKTEEPKSPGEKKAKESMKGKEFNEIESRVLEKSMDNMMKHVDQFDLSDLEQARFLYIGKPTKTNIPVIYLILSRVKTEFLMKNDKLMVYIFKTLQAQFKDKYVLVIDLSWTEMDDELQAALYRATVSFTRLIKAEFLANCQSIYLLHPTYKTQQAIDDILNIMTPEVRAKMVKTAYDWMDLSEVIEPNKIWIPFVSKKFTPLTYHLIKVNNVDKRKERYLKITHESILNIDSKACTIQNEIMLNKIEEIRSKHGSNEIIIKYNTETPEEILTRGATYFVKDNKKTGIQTKKYTCYTDQQREIVVEAIFEAGVRATSLSLLQTYAVDKQNKKGKNFKRVLKLTTDSLLVFKDKVIKTEIPYSTIQSFYLNETNKSLMYINFMLRGKKKQYILSYPKCEQMRDALLDAIKRFKYGVQLEKDLFYKKDYDAALDRFFLAAKSKESVKEKNDEENKWTNVLRIDQPANDLVKLFKKFKPVGDKAEISVVKMKEVISKLKLTLKEEEIEQVIKLLDPEEKGLITLDDLVKAWVFMRRQKQMIEKRKQALQKKSEQTQKK